MTDVIQFIPGDSPGPEVKEKMLEAVEQVCPGISEESAAAVLSGFGAMLERLNNPRRRIGGDVQRRGPVLFDAYQLLRRDDGHVETDQ